MNTSTMRHHAITSIAAVASITGMLFALSACGEDPVHQPATIDISSPQSLSRSLVAVRGELPLERQSEFDQAISYLSSPKPGAMFNPPEAVRSEYYAAVAGRDGDAVIIAARQDRVRRGNQLGELPVPGNLRSAVLVAEQTFRKNGYNDEDRDGVGEYATLAQLAGGEPTLGDRDGHVTPAGLMHLIRPELAGGELDGYRYALYLPGRGAPVDLVGDGSDEREKWFVCYAWPTQPQVTGSHTYAITQDGILRWRACAPGDAAPAWNELFTSKSGSAVTVFSSPGWEAAPAQQ